MGTKISTITPEDHLVVPTTVNPEILLGVYSIGSTKIQEIKQMSINFRMNPNVIKWY